MPPTRAPRKSKQDTSKAMPQPDEKTVTCCGLGSSGNLTGE